MPAVNFRRLVQFVCFGLLAGAGSLPASSPVVLPGRPVAHDRQAFEVIDVDKDGRVTKDEYMKYELRRRFEAADVNKDGKVSKEEYLASIKNEPRARHGEDEWKLLNSGKDSITIDDLMHNDLAAKEVSAEFKKLDRAGRGYVTMAEWTKKEKRRGKQAGSGQ